MAASASVCAQDVVKILHLDPPTAPAWVREVLGSEAKEQPAVLRESLVVRLEQSRDASFLRATFVRAADLDDPSFLAAVEGVYTTIGEILRARGELPLRFWNYIPEIRRRAPGGCSRYEVFNEGRFAGYRANTLGDVLAPASGVGHRGADLVVHVLASTLAGKPLENPRQTPAYRYSRRYGPVPPCFSRASLLERPLPPCDGARAAIVSGTASVTGEDSRHPGDLEAQLHETLLNLASLSAALAGECPSPRGYELDREARRALGRYRELRAYVVRDEDAERVAVQLRRAFPDLRRLELASADLCRSELLVEVEGLLSAEV